MKKTKKAVKKTVKNKMPAGFKNAMFRGTVK